MARFSSLLKAKTSFVIKRLSRSESRSLGYAHWPELSALEAAKVPCGAINNLAEVFADPHVQARGMVTHWQHPLKHDLKLVASPLKLEKTPVRTDLPPPLLGQHTDEVLGELLGFDAARIAALRDAGAV